MRLLRIFDLSFHEFFGEDIPAYCILSHRWGKAEVTYNDMVQRRFDRHGEGFEKIVGSARLARRRHYDWLWIDTCCIDKSSSTELSEAINSMFQWYERAGTCIAYLNDVDMTKDVNARVEAFHKSKWFTRGWTLQELIAPPEFDFYDCNFQHLGSRYDLSNLISHITGIATPYLDGRKRYYEASIAMRLSWSSSRVTTRPEDMSYSLLGLLQVHMPLLYGEGKAAFFRLQQTIIQTSDDESIFAWLPANCTDDDALYGMLAESPADFARSHNISRVKQRGLHREPYLLTNKGMSFIQQPPRGHSSVNKEIRLTLACRNPVYKFDGPELQTIVFVLRRVGSVWCRAKCTRFHHTTDPLSSSPTGGLLTFQIPQPNMPGNLITTGLDSHALAEEIQLDKARNLRRYRNDEKGAKYMFGCFAVGVATVAALVR